jgi:type 1 glutamine amidotransferase
MRSLRLMCFSLVCLAIANVSSAAEKSRVLMLTQSAGFTHGSVNRNGKDLAPAEIAMVQLGQSTDLFAVHCSQDATADLTKENLKNYDIVMFYTTGALPIHANDMHYFLNIWLKQKGHGFMAFHSGTDTFGDYEPYWDMVGGTFNGHPWGSGTKVTISVHEPDHPTMESFGKEFEIQDEIYQYKNWQPEKVRVLMSLNMAKCKPSKPYHVPVAWVKSYGKGKVYVNNLGHNEGSWADERYLKSITNAVKWMRGEVEGNSTPNPELSAAQEQLAKESAETAQQ